MTLENGLALRLIATFQVNVYKEKVLHIFLTKTNFSQG